MRLTNGTKCFIVQEMNILDNLLLQWLAPQAIVLVSYQKYQFLKIENNEIL